MGLRLQIFYTEKLGLTLTSLTQIICIVPLELSAYFVITTLGKCHINGGVHSCSAGIVCNCSLEATYSLVMTCNNSNDNFISFTKLPWPGYRSSCSTCPFVYHVGCSFLAINESLSYVKKALQANDSSITTYGPTKDWFTF